MRACGLPRAEHLALATNMSTPPSPRARPQQTGITEHDRVHPCALVILDMVGCWNFPDADVLLRGAARVAPAIARLKRRCNAAGVPVIYANDNSGQWRSDFKFVVRESLESGGAGAEITRLLEPGPEDYFVLKPKHSAFFATPLELLLDHLRTQQMIITGVAGDQCVLSTAADARMRDFEVLVPADCIASQTPARDRRALEQLREALCVRVPRAAGIRLQRRAPSKR
jgi:nicotinamidase-related amidase